MIFIRFGGVSADEPLYCPGDGPAQAPQQVPIETYIDLLQSVISRLAMKNWHMEGCDEERLLYLEFGANVRFIVHLVLQDPKVLITRRYNKAVEVQARIQRKEVTVYYSSYA
ncbi:hypothetical protein EYC84_001409 [Monilinia fructicola]|uniref:Uncharacterized protein n=1 Tax=Monilinia fructicola TaxID=38448 RepID=A0A5M9JU74_MONFR|nr:hypothetical protein EYC84_001409 [Monilinia fructicola]